MIPAVGGKGNSVSFSAGPATSATGAMTFEGIHSGAFSGWKWPEVAVAGSIGLVGLVIVAWMLKRK
jgi:hypothetical protein